MSTDTTGAGAMSADTTHHAADTTKAAH
jgi:hypothetical protein